MSFLALNFSKRIFLLLGCGSLTLGALLYFDSRPIIIESEESKTAELKPVYNQISFYPGRIKDIWVMKQSHGGPKLPIAHWDRVAMVVDKTKGEVEFLQLLSDQSPKSADLSQRIEFKASCFMCHSNGPRAIRPNFDSATTKISFWNQMRIGAWNLRIKTYGRLKSQSKGGTVPFRFSEPNLNEELKVRTCLKCHKADGLFARGALTRQNFMAIRFMIERGYMPPLGFSLPTKEREEVLNFVNWL